MLCWTSQGQLWNVDLAAEAAVPEHQEEVPEKPTSAAPRDLEMNRDIFKKCYYIIYIIYIL